MGKPLLWLFGPQFVVGYDIMFVLAFVMNVTLCIARVPRFGGHGAALKLTLVGGDRSYEFNINLD